MQFCVSAEATVWISHTSSVSEVGLDFKWRGVADVHLAFQHRRFFAASSIGGH